MTAREAAAHRAHPGKPRAFATVAGVFGLLAALAGLEHGIGALRQGGERPSVVYESWADTAAFEALGGEPAMTLIPSLEVTGVLAVSTSVLLGAWSLWVATQAPDLVRGGLGLLVISGALLVVGGGFGPPVIAAIVGVAALRQGRALGSRRSPGRLGRALAPAWATWTAMGVAGYLGLVPGVPLLHALAGAVSSGLVAALIVMAFAGLALSLVAAAARDRLEWTGAGGAQ